ncbi:GSCFA domain-containing protein [Flectobacillus major]|uniref:GSCFA domain-containing protein n=1 Tax=Flectobacillus major TaxID=103 RepID=UPI0003F9F7EF|nr:GSCFA domain-containing protein [Flectobacillus major]
MEFRTNIKLKKSANQLSLQSRVLTIGSCFAEVVGNQLSHYKIQTQVNPFGTLFNPMSIFKLLNKQYTQADERLFVQHSQTWFHYDFHSQFFGSTQEELRTQLNTFLSHQSLAQYDYLLITFGTSFVYKMLTYPTYVANCHKMPASLFEKDLLSVKSICKGFAELNQQLLAINPDLKIIITVSPVRHTKDGIPENQLSKSILRTACHYLSTDYPNVEYFPSYEIMMDDLRDYRFYKADMIHPNEVAEQYIFEQFAKVYFNEELHKFVPKWQQIQRALAHKPFNSQSEAHQKFLKNLLDELNSISHLVDISLEKYMVEKQLL